MIVIDASVVLAVLQGEPGSDVAIMHMRMGLLGAINLSEALAKMSDRGLPLEAADELIGAFGLTVVPFDSAQARTAARMRPATRYRNVSLGDRACLALAIERRLPLLTADTKWTELDLGIDIRLIR